MHQKVEQFLERLLCSSRFRLHEFADNRYMKIANPSHRPPLPPGNISGSHFCWTMSQPQDHSAAGRINSITPSEIELTTLRLVAQCLNQLRHRVFLLKDPTWEKYRVVEC